MAFFGENRFAKYDDPYGGAGSWAAMGFDGLDELEAANDDFEDIEALEDPTVTAKLAEVQGSVRMKLNDLLGDLEVAADNGLKQYIYGGKIIENPRAVLENFRQAQAVVESKLRPLGVEVDWDMVTITRLQGDALGQAVNTPEERGIFLDRYVTSLCAENIAHLLAHEFLHQYGEIQNEGLVEGMTQILIGGLPVPKAYLEQKNRVEEIATRLAPDGVLETGMEIVYRSFDNHMTGGLEAMNQIYHQNYVLKLPEEERNQAIEEFELAFPNITNLSEAAPGVYVEDTGFNITEVAQMLADKEHGEKRVPYYSNVGA